MPPATDSLIEVRSFARRVMLAEARPLVVRVSLPRMARSSGTRTSAIEGADDTAAGNAPRTYCHEVAAPPLEKALAEIRTCVAPSGMTTRIVAVDGPGGAGKSSLATFLARELDAPVVHTDDFGSWANPIDWWPQLLARVLVPLAAGKSAEFTPTSWDGRQQFRVVVEPQEFVVLEGVTASRAAFQPYLTYSIWIETPRELRLRRGLQRDGEEARADWERWMAGEDAYVEGERPADRADLVVKGDEDLGI